MSVINTRGFVDSDPFRGPKAISTVEEPYGALTCWSSTTAILADSSPFGALLLTVLGC